MAFTDIVKKSLTPLLYINMAAMGFSGLSLVWWGFLGSAGPGFIGLFTSPIVFPLLLLPAAILSGMLRLAMNSQVHPAIEKGLTFLSVIYLVSVLSGYTVMCFYFLVGAPEIPAATYAVSSAVLPWLIFASKDRENAFFTGLVIMMQISALLLVALNVILRLDDFERKFWIIWGIMMTCVGVEAMVEKISMDLKKRREGGGGSVTPAS